MHRTAIAAGKTLPKIEIVLVIFRLYKTSFPVITPLGYMVWIPRDIHP